MIYMYQRWIFNSLPLLILLDFIESHHQKKNDRLMVGNVTMRNALKKSAMVSSIIVNQMDDHQLASAAKKLSLKSYNLS